MLRGNAEKRLDAFMKEYRDDMKECMKVMNDDCHEYEYGHFSNILTRNELMVEVLEKMKRYEDIDSLTTTLSVNSDCDYFLYDGEDRAYAIENPQQLRYVIENGRL